VRIRTFFEQAKALRKQQTGAEATLWVYLRQSHWDLGFAGSIRLVSIFWIFILPHFNCH
jgi:very-short-patch-repair endonuclease